jgi:CRP-like cAMP-binding protein
VTALTASELLSVSHHELVAEPDAGPWSAQVWAGAGARIHALEARLVASLAAGGRARLAAVLLDLAERFGCRTDRGIEVDLDLTQADLAALVGASRETVNRLLAGFRRRGWIGPSRPGSHAIAVVDERGLRSFTELSP